MSENGRGINDEGGRMARSAEERILSLVSGDRPVLIAGPTASGKSALALAVARRTGGPIVNADAIQVYSDWRVLTARPSTEDEARHRHALYGHVPGKEAYSVGRWLNEVSAYLAAPAPVIVGGTGLYFAALTEGLADIPETPTEVRREADRRVAEEGHEALLSELDDVTAARIDTANPVRVQRAWEVLAATGRGLAAWQDETAPPRLPLTDADAVVLDAPRDWLTPRIVARTDAMLRGGALDEAERNAPCWDAGQPSAKAIGATELVAHVRDEIGLGEAREAIIVATRQYAKRQRSWFRSRMRGWRWIPAAAD